MRMEINNWRRTFNHSWLSSTVPQKKKGETSEMKVLEMVGKELGLKVKGTEIEKADIFVWKFDKSRLGDRSS